MPNEEKAPLVDVLRRAQLVTRLSAAAGFLRGARMTDSGDAVLEAIELIRMMPVAEYVHKALHPEAMSNAEFTRLVPGLKTGSLREVKGRLKERLAEFNELFPLVDGQTLKPVAESADEDGMNRIGRLMQHPVTTRWTVGKPVSELTDYTEYRALAEKLHYPRCWDTAAYPTLDDAAHEAGSGPMPFVCSTCTLDDHEGSTLD